MPRPARMSSQSSPQAFNVPNWAHACSWACVGAAAPTIIWRALVGAGITLGTSPLWRAAEQIPGHGVGYVFSLSAVELAAALMAPFALTRLARRLLPWPLTMAGAIAGELALLGVITLSMWHWDAVDPFRGQPPSAWSQLCTGCYLTTVLWPLALAGVIAALPPRRT